MQMVFNGFFGIRKFSYLKAGTRDFKTKRGRGSGFKNSSVYANETINFQIWPTIVGAGSFWNCQSKLLIAKSSR